MISGSHRTSHPARPLPAALLLLCTGLTGCASHPSMVVEELSRHSRIPTSELKQLLADCDRTQRSMNICAFRDFVATDLELDAALEAKHESVARQCQVERDRTQFAWETEHDRACNEETKTNEGGSMRPMLISDCKTIATKERISWVKEINPCSSTPTNFNPSEVNASMHDATMRPSPSDNPRTIAPEKVVKDFMEFISTIHSERDLESSRFWTAMHMPPQEINDDQYFAEESGYQAFSQQLPNTPWSYLVSFVEISEEPRSKSVRLEFNHPGNRVLNKSLDLGPVCGVDLEAFRKEMVGAGFLEGPSEPDRFEYEDKGVMAFIFMRGDIFVDVFSQWEAAEPEAKHQHACIRSIEARINLVPHTNKAGL